MVRAVITSSPSVGSSKIITGGSWTSVRAIDTFCFIPLESLSQRRSSNSPIPSVENTSRMRLSIEKVQAANEEVRRRGVRMMVGFNRRFDPNFLKVRETIARGLVGQPHVLRITSRDPGPPPEQYIRASGGIFMDMTIHDFDMARYLMGSEVTEVYTRAAVLV